MKTFEAPSWMIAPMVSTGVKQSDYFLYAAGRALGMMKMAALALEHLDNSFAHPGSPLKEAEYIMPMPALARLGPLLTLPPDG